MLIHTRNAELKYPRAIKEEKTKLVLEWLLEFRFSSIDLLSKRIGSNPVNANRFFNALISDGVIQVFKNVHTMNERYVMLTTAGLAYLEVWGLDISRGVTKVAHLGRYSHIMHDMAVQNAVLNRLNSYVEVIWDRHIDFADGSERPDALLKSQNNYWVALEYERWRKDKKRIFINYYHHVEALKKRHYRGVYFLFDKEADMKYYQSVFNEPEWPLYKRFNGTGRISPLNKSFRTDSIPNLRDCFVFLFEPIE